MIRYLSALAALMALGANPAVSQTQTSQFSVQMTITADCQITSAGSLSFGSAGVIATNRDGTSAIVVQCTNGTAYNVGLNEGTGTGATVATRKMTGPGAATVNYTLYSDSAHSSVWGNTVGTDTKSANGTGAAQSYTVYGRVLPQTTPAPGSYSDTVTVTLTY
jgi:spore coat protein U-like protein